MDDVKTREFILESAAIAPGAAMCLPEDEDIGHFVKKEVHKIPNI